MHAIIYPPTIDWNWMKQRPQQLLSRLARLGFTVFYCNPTQTQDIVQEVEPRLNIVHNHHEWLTKDLPRIRRQYCTVGIWCSYPPLVSTLHMYNADWIIYDCVDDFDDWLPYESQIVAMASTIICSSQPIHDRLQKTFPQRKIHIVRNGYDTSMQLHKRDILTSTNNVVGYVGAWAPWINQNIILQLASQQDIDVIIIGPEFDRKFTIQLPNLHYLGLKKHYELAAYIRTFDVCIIPFSLTPLTLAVNPVKAYEYLASGLPVVSTALPECSMMSPHINIANTSEEFIAHVCMCLKSKGDSQARRQYALANSWEVRAVHVKQIILEPTINDFL